MENYGKYTDETEFRVDGYTNRWGIIDSKKVDDIEYFLLENNYWGDETCYLVVDSSKVIDKNYTNKSSGEKITLPTFTEVVCETFDDIETALTDEGIINESIKEEYHDQETEEDIWFDKIYHNFPREVQYTLDNSWSSPAIDRENHLDSRDTKIYFKALVDCGIISKDEAERAKAYLRSEDGGAWDIEENLKEDINPNEQGIFKAGNIIINTEPLFYCDKENLDIIFDDDEIEKIKTSNFINNNGDFIIPKYSRIKVITKQSPGGGWPMLEIIKLSEILGEPVELDFAYDGTDEEFEAMFTELY